MWVLLALGSAVFAALTSILAKIGIEGVDSTLATAVRTVVVVVMAWLMVGVVNGAGTAAQLTSISTRSWVFLILSGFATGASWLCYYAALQLGEASKVVPIDKLSVVITLVLAALFLGEQLTARTAFGAALIAAGTLVLVW